MWMTYDLSSILESEIVSHDEDKDDNDDQDDDDYEDDDEDDDDDGDEEDDEDEDEEDDNDDEEEEEVNLQQGLQCTTPSGIFMVGVIVHHTKW